MNIVQHGLCLKYVRVCSGCHGDDARFGSCPFGLASTNLGCRSLLAPSCKLGWVAVGWPQCKDTRAPDSTSTDDCSCLRRSWLHIVRVNVQPVHERPVPVPVPVPLPFMHALIIFGCWVTGAFAGSGEGGRGRGGRGRGRSGAASPGLPGGEINGASPLPGTEAPAARCVASALAPFGFPFWLHLPCSLGV